MKNIHVIEVQASSMEEGLKQVMEKIEEIVGAPETREGEIFKLGVRTLEATIENIEETLDHVMNCPGCAKHVDRNLAMAAFKVSMQTAVTALQEVIKAEEVVLQEIKKSRGVK